MQKSKEFFENSWDPEGVRRPLDIHAWEEESRAENWVHHIIFALNQMNAAYHQLYTG
jgi:hypothetical protein